MSKLWGLQPMAQPQSSIRAVPLINTTRYHVSQPMRLTRCLNPTQAQQSFGPNSRLAIFDKISVKSLDQTVVWLAGRQGPRCPSRESPQQG